MIFGLVMAIIFSAFTFRLYNLQVVNEQTYAEQADKKKTKTITLTGSRGKILDSKGSPLAYSRRCFNVQIYRDPSHKSTEQKKAYTNSILEVIRAVEKRGKSTIDGFWLKRDSNGNWVFDTGTTNAKVAEKREKQWRANFVLNKTAVKDLFNALCKNYSVPEELPEEDKIKILTVWQEIQMNAYISKPVTIAEDVDFETVAELEARSMELTGISIGESTQRVYPRGSLAAHAIGYVGKISDDATMEYYKERGYSTDAIVGQTGIELSMEDHLTPFIEYRQGKQEVEIDRRGKIIRQLSYIEPMDGNDVQLTIDSDLQAVAEKALEENIKEINEAQQAEIEKESWQRRYRRVLDAYEENNIDIELAETGAVAVIEVNTGRILALASYPSFDLSLLTGPIDPQVWNSLVTDERYPMFNRAVSTKDAPGSTFKMVTALAGLMEGKVTPEETIYDQVEYKGEGIDTARPPKCWSSHGHGNMDVISAISNSCNYYFYEVGYRLGSTTLSKWAAQLGLTSSTGIELREESSFVGNQSMLYDSSRAINDQQTSKPYYAAKVIKKELQKIGEDRGITYDEERLDRVTKSLLDIVTTTETKSEWPSRIHDILLTDMNLPSEYISNNFLANTFQSYLNDLKWTANETVMTAIGQSITQTTPVALARYIAAIANGGTVYNAQIVDKIISPTGEVVLEKEPSIANKIEGADGYFAYIQEGMRRVTSTENDGTAAKYYKNTKYPMAAKTGTSTITKVRAGNLDVENNSWHVAYGPADNPEIAVVVYIQNGFAGGRSSPTAIKIITSYLDAKNQTEDIRIEQSNALAD